MSRYRINDQFGMYFITLTVVDWVDVFTRKIYKDILIESIRFCQENKGLIVYGYVIMSNHVHMILKADGNIPLSDILRDYKKYTATIICSEDGFLKVNITCIAALLITHREKGY